MWLYFRLFLFALRLLRRSRRDLVLENLVLRQQLLVHERPDHRPRLTVTDRRFWSTLAGRWGPWRAHVRIVQPPTVVRWHRTAWRRYWTRRSQHRRPGRPRISARTRALIREMSRENPTWGAIQIVGALQNLDISVSRTTVRRYRLEALRRPPSPRWRTFLRLHAPHIWATDLFTVQTLTFRTFYVLLVVSHDRRRIEHWNVTRHPNAAWIWRQIVEATPWGRRPRYLIRDRDARYGRDFVARAAKLGIQTIITPVRAPQANAIAERCIGTLRRECLDHLIVINERHLRAVLREYVAYYNGHRPHRSLGLEPPDGPPPIPAQRSRIVSRPILGGLHHVYEWAA
ncbi:MAG TPA: integrase core domain-containing protein [Chloroflexota bacterium]|nr:integrase core domain-containing protein [Chloroflexota bacterium]